MLRAWLLQHREWGFSCALWLLVEEQSHLVLRLRFLLVWWILLLLPLMFPARPVFSSVRGSPALAGVDVARLAMGPVERRRSILGVVLRPPGRSSHHRERSCRSSSDSSEDDRAETYPPMSGCAPGGTPGDSRPAPVGDRSSRPGPSGWRARSSAGAERYRSGFGGSLSLAPLGEAVPLMLWTSTGMTLSGPSWPSSGTSTAWNSRRVFLQLDARLLLHGSMG